MIIPAPNITRNSTHRNIQITIAGGAVSRAPRKIARKPLSSRSVSHPKPYQTWPTLTIERYATHIHPQIATLTGVPNRSEMPLTASSAHTMPDHDSAIANRSE